jgi:hypothetical protein
MTRAVKAVAPDAGTLAQNNTGYFSTSPDNMREASTPYLRVWHRTLAQDGRPVARDSRTVDVHVSRVRRKLGPRHGRCLVTEYRVGYQYRPQPT